MRNSTVIKCRRNGFALIVVLLIVATISILSLGYATKADRELSFGENVEVRMQMDYLLQTGLNYGKSLVMNPQNVSTGSNGYWEGGSGLQMEGGSDYFDVAVSHASGGSTKKCSYEISCEAYRDAGDDNIIATRGISGELRLDPCIGYVQLNDNMIGTNVTVNGDMYCDMDLQVLGVIQGDLFSVGAVTWSGSNITGSITTGVAECPVSIPSLQIADYATEYYIGSQSYAVEVIDPNGGDGNLELEPSAGNPAGIFYCDDHLDLKGVTEITGTLVVNGDLRINDNAVTITAVKNFPALLVGNNIDVITGESAVDVTGLTQIGGSVALNGEDDCVLNFTGALHILDGMIENSDGLDTSVNITADPMAAALKTWSNGGNTVTYWMPAGDAYFKRIARN